MVYIKGPYTALLSFVPRKDHILNRTRAVAPVMMVHPLGATYGVFISTVSVVLPALQLQPGTTTLHYGVDPVTTKMVVVARVTMDGSSYVKTSKTYYSNLLSRNRDNIRELRVFLQVGADLGPKHLLDLIQQHAPTRS